MNGHDKANSFYWNVLHGIHDTESLNGQVRVHAHLIGQARIPC